MELNNCKCWICTSFSPKLKKFESKLPAELHDEFNILMNELWNMYESDSTELGCLNAKIEGVWPRDDGEKYYTRVGGKLYEVQGTLVDE